MNVPAKIAHDLVQGRQTKVRIPITKRRKPRPGNDEPVRPVYIDQLKGEDEDGNEIVYEPLRQVGKSLGMVLIVDVVTDRDTREWELTVRPTDRVRLLAPAARPAHFDPADDHDDDAIHGYTNAGSLALPGEPGAVDPDTLQRHWTDHAQTRHAKARTVDDQRRRAKALARRLADQTRAELNQGDHERAAQRLDLVEHLLETGDDERTAA